MKKNLLIGAIFFSGALIAQTINGVGIEVEKPTETLHVEGTARVTELPTNEKGTVYTKKEDGKFKASDAKDQPFNATRTLVADDNGVLGVVSYLPTVSDGSYTNDEESGEATFIGTTIFIPEKKCAKNVIGDGSKKKYSMDFEKSGYRFSWFDKNDKGGVAGLVQVDVQRIGEYANQKRRAKTTMFTPYAATGDAGDFEITSTPTMLMDASFQNSNAAMLTFIVQETAQVFHLDLTTINGAGNIKVMNICVEQTTF